MKQDDTESKFGIVKNAGAASLAVGGMAAGITLASGLVALGVHKASDLGEGINDALFGSSEDLKQIEESVKKAVKNQNGVCLNKEFSVVTPDGKISKAIAVGNKTVIYRPDSNKEAISLTTFWATTGRKVHRFEAENIKIKPQKECNSLGHPSNG